MWPLKAQMHSPNSASTGLQLNGYFDGNNVIEFPTQAGDEDFISLHIASFETDSPSSSAIGIPFYNLMPCEEIHIFLALEHHTLFNRLTNPCRDDFPSILRSEFKIPLTVDLFYNAVFFPNLPYSKKTCTDMCISRYWRRQCGCYRTTEVWNYAGKPADVPVCPTFGANCSRFTTFDAPWEVIQDCDCHPKCSEHRFRIVADDKIRYSYGKIEWRK